MTMEMGRYSFRKATVEVYDEVFEGNTGLKKILTILDAVHSLSVTTGCFVEISWERCAFINIGFKRRTFSANKARKDFLEWAEKQMAKAKIS